MGPIPIVGSIFFSWTARSPETDPAHGHRFRRSVPLGSAPKRGRKPSDGKPEIPRPGLSRRGPSGAPWRAPQPPLAAVAVGLVMRVSP